MVDASRISSHGLYSNSSVTRYLNEIDKVKANKAGPYSIEDFTHFDSLSYCGNKFAASAFETMNLSSASVVLDLCSGIGATARLVSSRYNAEVFAIDLIEGLSRVAGIINDLCGLTKIQSINNDVCYLDLANLGIEGRCDLVYSIQSFVHIDNKQPLFTTCFNALRSGGAFYIEDHIRDNNLPMTEEEDRLCDRMEFADHITKEEYTQKLEAAGFVVESVQLRPVDFAQFVYGRAETWLTNKAAIIAAHGEDFWNIRVRQGIEVSCRMYHNLGMSVEKAKQAYTALVEYLGTEEFERILTLPHKFTGAYIIARKP